MKHELKILPEWYETLKSGIKTFEVRKEDDKHFSPGDKLFLKEFDGTKYTGRTMSADVFFVLRGEYCKHGYCIMSVKVTDCHPSRITSNADRIRSFTDLQLEEFLCGLIADAFMAFSGESEIRSPNLTWLHEESNFNKKLELRCKN